MSHLKAKAENPPAQSAAQKPGTASPATRSGATRSGSPSASRAPAQKTSAQECAEIRALIETIVPRAAAVFYPGRAWGEEEIRRSYRRLRDDDLAGWRNEARRLVKDLAVELLYAEEDRPDDPSVVASREFHTELVSTHPWLAGNAAR